MIEDSLLLERIKKKITNYQDVRNSILEAKKYYRNENKILDKGIVPKQGEGKNPLRNADNRIPHNLHQVLVDEKISYLFTYPPIVQIEDNEELTDKVTNILGEEFDRKLKNIGIEASNCGTSWVHYWIKENKETGEKQFKYALVNTEEIIPIYDNGLERELKNIIRYYTIKEEVEGQIEEETFTYVEYWTDKEFIRWKMKGSYTNQPIEILGPITHKLEAVPFIELANNKEKQSDLNKIKRLLDLKDVVVSGFANDIEDIQEIIYILENYGGTDLSEFLNDLKRYKTVKTESMDGNSGGLSTLSIDIPVEARNVLIEYLKKEIYEAGQGLQQDVESMSNASGVVLKFFYRKLELKAGLMETECRIFISELVKAIMKFLGINEEYKITQTYTRNMISNDLENAQIAQMCTGIISKKTILENHPWVDDVQMELDRLDEEKQQEESIFEQPYEIQQKEPAEVGEEDETE